MRRITGVLFSLLLVTACLALPGTVRADCPGNLLTNPGFEEGEYKTEVLGTSLSSSVGEGWIPWSVLGDATYNREVEYKVLRAQTLPNTYHIHGGSRSQKFFTTWGTHTAGFYQRVAVPKGSLVTFSIWVQIYTAQRELVSDGNFISDLNPATPENPEQGSGNYRVYVGIDPYGDVPAGFGEPPSPRTVWAGGINENDTRSTTPEGTQVDEWVLLRVSAIAQSDYVTVYTKGQPEFPVKHNDSFWDDACLIAEAPPTPTPSPTNTPTNTPVATVTPLPTDTLVATATPLPTDTLAATATYPPTDTPFPTVKPTSLPSVTPTGTAIPTSMEQPSAVPTPSPTSRPTNNRDPESGAIASSIPSPVPTNLPAPTSVSSASEEPGHNRLLPVYVCIVAAVAIAAGWIGLRRRA